VIAIDGKTIRGARRRDQGAPHLVAALDHASGTVLGQCLHGVAAAKRSRHRCPLTSIYRRFHQILEVPEGTESESVRSATVRWSPTPWRCTCCTLRRPLH